MQKNLIFAQPKTRTKRFLLSVRRIVQNEYFGLETQLYGLIVNDKTKAKQQIQQKWQILWCWRRN